MRGFSGFLDDLELVDLPLLGRRFTWCHANGSSMSRIDRVIVSPEWMEVWGVCSLWVCPRDVSDHCPLVLRYANNDWGPKPFRFNNYWIDHKKFKKVVEDSWKAQEVSGWMAFVLQEKLRGLKCCLKEWNKIEFGSMETSTRKLVDEIQVLDIKGESTGLSPHEVILRKELFIEFWKIQKLKEAAIFQRSRSKWLSQGDANSKFFHGCVVARTKRNFISALKVDNIWLESPFQIREAVENFFQSHFSAPRTIRPNLDGVSFPSLSLADNCILSAPFSLEEIHKVVKESDVNSKNVSARLAKVMNPLIASNQSAFIKGRNLVDGVLVVNEVVDLAKRTGKDCLIFKVDFEKAYDSVDWGFLEYMLRRFGFCEVWIGWMRACIFGGNLSVLVNGSPTGEINIQRGLKQGDPLAPFLFLLVAEGLEGVMRRAGDLDLFKGFTIRRGGPTISHLQYADDTLCIGEASVENLWTLKAILRGFELASGLRVNFWKSCLMGVNVSNNFMEVACTFLNCIRGGVPFKYLGLPVGANPRRMSTWEPLVERIRKKLNSWGNKHISLGGRLVLINSVLNSIPIFYLSFMKMPAQVIKKVTRIQRDFLWGGVNGHKKLSWVKWKVICQEKKNGGLGIRDLKVTNISLLMKWRWRLLQSNDTALWKEVLVAKYGDHILLDVNWSNGTSPSFASLWWKDIRDLEVCVESQNWLSEVFIRRLGNGALTRFWIDNWIGDHPLCVVFPRLFSLSSQQSDSVQQVVVSDGGENRRWNLLWRRALFQWEEERVDQLLLFIGNVNLSLDEDKWCWVCSPDGFFSVKSAYDVLLREIVSGPNLNHLKTNIFKSIWESPAPSKVIAFSWQLLHDRVPTKDNLLSRGIINHEMGDICVGCEELLESSSHLFMHCKVAHLVWYEIFKWLGVVLVMPPNLFYLFDYFSAAAFSKKSSKGFRMVGMRSFGLFGKREITRYLMVSRWTLWKLRRRRKLYPGSGVWRD
ncbi:hypothetical protein TSUD_334390 [Trifolium subterraneum]|uniref:Reverse transcriptase domain-containing protein n=1 Tax=Trifolium subterraneum TaxID=3900 RepID=A0A2Z6LVA3_TRISU|nr:hypothetical protein TSUD_334390 [Trifolium subterraneum]